MLQPRVRDGIQIAAGVNRDRLQSLSDVEGPDQRHRLRIVDQNGRVVDRGIQGVQQTVQADRQVRRQSKSAGELWKLWSRVSNRITPLAVPPSANCSLANT